MPWPAGCLHARLLMVQGTRCNEHCFPGTQSCLLQLQGKSSCEAGGEQKQRTRALGRVTSRDADLQPADAKDDRPAAGSPWPAEALKACNLRTVVSSFCSLNVAVMAPASIGSPSAVPVRCPE
eukprot:scaffold181335_cov43-Prasinocladus_malaysianus.AAC.2